MFYTERAISRTVTFDFLISHLAPQHHSRANDYWKSIKLRARRIFLILLDIGVPSQVVFGGRDEHLENKFYERQWQYLLRDINEGSCVELGEEEAVPIVVIPRSSSPESHGMGIRKGSLQHVQQVVTDHASGFGLGQGGNASERPMALEDRVALPDQPPGMVFTRRRIPLFGSKEQQPDGQGGTAGYTPTMTREEFLREVVAIKSLNLQNEHLARYFASYTHRGNGYMLFTPATTEHTFKSILTTGNLPASVKYLEKGQQRRLIMEWIHCLVDTVCWLHSKGLAHGAIRPSNIFLAEHNDLPVLADFHTRASPTLGSGPVIEKGQTQNFDKEAYDYAAPELARYYRPTSSSTTTSMSLVSRKNTATSFEARPSTSASVSRPASPPWPFHHPSPCPNYHLPSPSSPTSSQTHHLQVLQAADVFVLSCIILDILSFLVFKKHHGTRAFAAHRAANPKHKTPGRGGALPDSSYHRNLDQVKSWMTELVTQAETKVAASKKKKHSTFGGIGSKLHLSGLGLHLGHGHGTSGNSSSEEGGCHHGYGEKKDSLEGIDMMVKVVEGMLNPDPTQRKTALEVQAGTYLALREGCGIEEPHCVHEYGPSPLGRLTIKPPSPSRTPKQTTPTPSMYGGSRMRSNSAVSTNSASASTPVPAGLWSRSFSISAVSASASRWSHSTSSRSSASSASLGFPNGFFSTLGGRSHGNSNYDHGQPGQRRTSSRASGPKQLRAMPSSTSLATASLAMRPRTATPTTNSAASTIIKSHQQLQHQQYQPRTSYSTCRGASAPRSQSTNRAQSRNRDRDRSRCSSRTRGGDHHQHDGHAHTHETGNGNGNGEPGQTIWRRILYGGNGSASDHGTDGTSNHRSPIAASVSAPVVASPPAPATAVIQQSSTTSKLAGKLKRKPDKTTSKNTESPRIGGGLGASPNYRRRSQSITSQASVTSSSLTRSWRGRLGSTSSGTGLFGFSTAGSLTMQ
ncbi:hypothetical protein B0T20DRAFT_61028 [Sordaria brevicollis]|uniref:Protein kinase domain-containing protein n=1 Tax=Sordaria brevicollis TaxID=83679 RepID=A0AAE0P3R0_SORBR|nr:hypothetical protein B0T20DRAFT_61028 [Sordaria brevicollis]